MTLQEVPKTRFAWFFGLAITGCIADLATKSWLFGWPELRRPGAVWWIWDGHVGFQLAMNPGALFGLGEGWTWLFALLSIVALIAIPIWLFGVGAARDRLICISLGMITGGILGNLYDRLAMHGLDWSRFRPDKQGPAHAVRDWILLQYNNGTQWPNFNIADSLLVTAACLLVVQAFLSGRTAERSEK